MKTEIVLIAAVARNGVIGSGNALLWHLPEDMRHFREATAGHAVIMGRKTWDSLPERFRPLPGRRNIVVTRQAAWVGQGAERAHSLQQALQLVAAAPRAFVIGGAQLYAAALPVADALLLTEIDQDYAGDAHFPGFDRRQFVEVARRPGAGSAPAYTFVDYRRT